MIRFLRRGVSWPSVSARRPDAFDATARLRRGRRASPRARRRHAPGPHAAATRPAACPAAAATRPAAPAATPGEALARSMQAMADIDEAAYRRATVIESPTGYSDAYTRMMFASYRLRRAVREHGVTGRRVRDAGWDRDQTLSSGVIEPMPEAQWGTARDAIGKLEWKIDGDVAEPVGARRGSKGVRTASGPSDASAAGGRCPERPGGHRAGGTPAVFARGGPTLHPRRDDGEGERRRPPDDPRAVNDFLDDG